MADRQNVTNWKGTVGKTIKRVYAHGADLCISFTDGSRLYAAYWGAEYGASFYEESEIDLSTLYKIGWIDEQAYTKLLDARRCEQVATTEKSERLLLSELKAKYETEITEK